MSHQFTGSENDTQLVIVHELTHALNVIAAYLSDATPDAVITASHDGARIARILSRFFEGDLDSARIEWSLLSGETQDMLDEMASTFVALMR